MVRITFADPDYSRPGNRYKKGDIGELTGNTIADASLVEVAFSDSDKVWVPRGNLEVAP